VTKKKPTKAAADEGAWLTAARRARHCMLDTWSDNARGGWWQHRHESSQWARDVIAAADEVVVTVTGDEDGGGPEFTVYRNDTGGLGGDKPNAAALGDVVLNAWKVSRYWLEQFSHRSVGR
jgi:hypothetical protein